MQNLAAKIPRFILISIIPKGISEEEIFGDIEELGSLVETYGGEVVDIVIQKREVHDKGPYIGTGKVARVGEIIQEKGVDVVVLNAIIKPTQIYELFEIWSKVNLKIEVWDRVDLILKIFSKQANTSEARLQIELAAMRHMGPRIYGMGIEMSRQGGGIGTRGIGETNTERMKRHWRNEMKKTQEKLEKLSKDRQAVLKRRREVGLKTASLIGYTNAGKTSLFNKLTGKDKYVENKLFATLDSTVGPIYLPPIKSEILVSDTIGFIRDLPPQLIDAFKSTLMESIYSDVLIHVIDVSDPDMKRKIVTVEEILRELGLQHKKRIYVFNKIDQPNLYEQKAIVKKYIHFSPIFISTKTGEGLEEMITKLESMFTS
jgi:GTP-binding protein HflX